MKNKKDIIDIICQSHGEIREKLVFIKELLVVFDKDNVWKDIRDVLNFFDKNIVKHFKDEEILISVLKRDTQLQTDESEIIIQILQEHKELLEKYEDLKKIAEKFDYDNQTIKENFVMLSHNIIEKLLSHAEYEDKNFFPFVRQKLKKKQLKEIEEMITK